MNSSMVRASDGTLDLPEDSLILGEEHPGPQPHVFMGDEAFLCWRNLMRHFPEANLFRRNMVFNYRLSRARLTVECTFGILASQWRRYQQVIGVHPTNAEACEGYLCPAYCNFMRMVTRSQCCV